MVHMSSAWLCSTCQLVYNNALGIWQIAHCQLDATALLHCSMHVVNAMHSTKTGRQDWTICKAGVPLRNSGLDHHRQCTISVHNLCAAAPLHATPKNVLSSCMV
jgi:hypothetical protein